MPTNPTSAHSVRFCGHFDRKTTARSTRTIDATANRRDADKNGGAPSRPIRIGSHVDPQMRHNIANAALRVGLVAIGPRDWGVLVKPWGRRAPSLFGGPAGR